MEQLTIIVLLVINITVVAFLYGRLTQTVSDHGRRIKGLEATVYKD